MIQQILEISTVNKKPAQKQRQVSIIYKSDTTIKLLSR